MRAHNYTVVMLLAGDDTAVVMTSPFQAACLTWLNHNGANINKPGTNAFETEDGVVYEIRREVA